MQQRPRDCSCRPAPLLRENDAVLERPTAKAAVRNAAAGRNARPPHAEATRMAIATKLRRWEMVEMLFSALFSDVTVAPIPIEPNTVTKGMGGNAIQCNDRYVFAATPSL